MAYFFSGLEKFHKYLSYQIHEKGVCKLFILLPFPDFTSAKIFKIQVLFRLLHSLAKSHHTLPGKI